MTQSPIPVDEASVGGEAAGRPVGHSGTRVVIDERTAWSMSGALALLIALALLAFGVWTIIDAAIHRQWLVAMGRRSGLSHLAHLVCELYLRLQAVGQTGDLSFDLPLTQNVLGDALGLSTVHVSRLISELRAEGVVQWSGGRIDILDWRRLAEIAEFDPTYLRLQSEPV